MTTAMHTRLSAILAVAVLGWAVPAAAGWDLTLEGPTDNCATFLTLNYGEGTSCGQASAFRWNYLDLEPDDSGVRYNSVSQAELDKKVPYFMQSSEATVRVDGYKKWTWRWDLNPPFPSEYNFSFDVRAVVQVNAYIDVLSGSGFRKFVSHGYARLVGDTATMEVESDQRDIWVGAEHIVNTGGITGFGLGPGGGSIQWSDPDPQDWTPYESKYEYVHISATDDDPGNVCFVQILTEAETQVGKFSYNRKYNNDSMGDPHLDLFWGGHKLEAPRLINP